MIEPELSLTFKRTIFSDLLHIDFLDIGTGSEEKIRVCVGVKAFDRKQKKVQSK